MYLLTMRIMRTIMKIYNRRKYLRFREVEKIILDDGWYLVNQKGSHRQYRHPQKVGKVTIPDHRGDIHPDVVKSIYRQAGLAPI